MHTDTNKCYLKSCTSPITENAANHESYIMDFNFHTTNNDDTPALTPKSVVAYPTRTVFEMELEGVLSVTLTTLTPLLTDKIELLSRPVTVIALDVKALDGKEHEVQAYFDVTGEFAVNNLNEQVQWENWDNSVAMGARIGTVEQNPFVVWGDHVNINWGYVNLAVARNQTVGAGYSKDLRDGFMASGKLPEEFPSGPWRAVNVNTPAIAAVHNLGKVNANGGRALFAYALDEEYAMYYFGKKLRPADELLLYIRRQLLKISKKLLLVI